MENKVVKISSYHLLQYFYPDYKVREELSFVDRDNYVIYIGKPRPNIKRYLEERTKGYISVVGMPELDLTDAKNLVEWVYQKRGKVPAKKTLEGLENMDLSYVEYLVKVFWVTGKWVEDNSFCEKTMYNLFQDSVSSMNSCMKTYFELREVYPYEVIEASYLTFLSRVLTVEDQNASPGYMKLLKQASLKFGSKIRPLVVQLGASEDSELAFINMLTELR